MDCRSNPLPGITGYWIEEMPASQDRRYSIGFFQYNSGTGCYTYDGANYSNDGRVFCTWHTTSLSVDLRNRKIYYIFQASKKGELYNVNYGFGVLNLEEQDGRLVPANGFYRETLIDAKPYSHDMRRLEEAAKEHKLKQNPDESIEDFQSRVVEACCAKKSHSLIRGGQ